VVAPATSSPNRLHDVLQKVTLCFCARFRYGIHIVAKPGVVRSINGHLYNKSRIYQQSLVLIYCIVFFRPFATQPKKPRTPHNVDSQASPNLCNCLFFFSHTIYRSVECIYHPIVHYIMISECTNEDCAVFDREENVSELSSQLFLFLEL